MNRPDFTQAQITAIRRESKAGVKERADHSDWGAVTLMLAWGRLGRSAA